MPVKFIVKVEVSSVFASSFLLKYGDEDFLDRLSIFCSMCYISDIREWRSSLTGKFKIFW